MVILKTQMRVVSLFALWEVSQIWLSSPDDIVEGRTVWRLFKRLQRRFQSTLQLPLFIERSNLSHGFLWMKCMGWRRITCWNSLSPHPHFSARLQTNKNLPDQNIFARLRGQNQIAILRTRWLSHIYVSGRPAKFPAQGMQARNLIKLLQAFWLHLSFLAWCLIRLPKIVPAHLLFSCSVPLNFGRWRGTDCWPACAHFAYHVMLFFNQMLIILSIYIIGYAISCVVDWYLTYHHTRYPLETRSFYLMVGQVVK